MGHKTHTFQPYRFGVRYILLSQKIQTRQNIITTNLMTLHVDDAIACKNWLTCPIILHEFEWINSTNIVYCYFPSTETRTSSTQPIKYKKASLSAKSVRKCSYTFSNHCYTEKYTFKKKYIARDTLFRSNPVSAKNAISYRNLTSKCGK